ncbi:hypothetical protein [Thermomonospora cellulosilytica]|uniref:Uncharacterized protein n=1 Tax=Thermomonospora cellulosilytica TaxID=1411118 RepID=A0A7W3R897_9ACTN|nr:hypothetical protein [Thermomonospora cellulosilytica]MBA9003451.1 hypothetical protein [Thermomonospora cellulosilytica]
MAGAGVVLVAGCGSAAGPSDAELVERARQIGVDKELVHVMELKGFRRAVGAMGVYGDDGFQDVYVSDTGVDVRLTVERRGLTVADCPRLPIPAMDVAGAGVRCVQDGDGWRRTGGDRQEYAVTRGDLLVRVSGQVGRTTFGLLRDAAAGAKPASPAQLDEMLPPANGSGSGGGEISPPPRGDLPPHGDGAPDNHVGPGG